MSLKNSSRTICDRYRLLEVLGRGGMGTVWRAHDERLQREVAIKEVELPASLPDELRASSSERAMREARAAARLSHAGAVTIFDVQQDSGRAYLVMELVDAPTLADVLERQGPLTPKRAAQIGRDVLGALEAAHSVGIVHRDVKPANVMIPPHGTAKLADFGIASVKNDPKITQTGFILGSPSYMAPEQADGRGSGPEADLWALGATLYYAVEGTPPFEAGAAIPTLAAVLHDTPRPPQNAGPLAPVINGLLEKDPTRRPSHAEVRRMLEEAASGTSHAVVATTPAPETEPAARSTGIELEPDRSQRRVWPVALALLIALALLSVAAIAFLGGEEREGRRGSGSGTAQAPAGSGAGAAEEPGSDTAEGEDPASDSAIPSEEEIVAGTAPAGWTTYEDPTVGWSIAYPEGWTIEPDPIGDGSSVDISDPETGAYLRVDWQSPPGPSAVGAWRDQEASFAADHAGYERIALEPTEFRDYEAATWEFTWEEESGTVHAVDLGFIVGDDYGFALNFVAPDSEWESLQDEFTIFQETYAPPE